MTEYKPGDRVVRTFKHTTRQKGTIENRYSQTSDYYLVKEDGGESRFWYSDYFELLKEEYKPGDRVRRTFECDHAAWPFTKGATGTLICERTRQGWMVECNGNKYYWSTVNFERDTSMDFEKRDKLVKYLLDAQRTWPEERYIAFRELTNLGAFSPSISTDTFLAIVNKYAEDNPYKFCVGGIEDARKVTGIQAPIKTQSTVFTVTLTRPKPDRKTTVSAWQDWIQTALDSKLKSMISYDDFSFKVEQSL